MTEEDKREQMLLMQECMQREIANIKPIKMPKRDYAEDIREAREVMDENYMNFLNTLTAGLILITSLIALITIVAFYKWILS